MNASRLREIAELLGRAEKQFKIQQLLTDLNNSLSNLASNPQQSDYQTQFASAFQKLSIAFGQIAASFQPSQVRLLEEIGADRFFNGDISTEISQWIQENPISPAVTQGKVATFLQQRADFLETLDQIRRRLKALKIEANGLAEGTAEIGFLIPRDLFHNHFDELIKELGVINTIIRIFAKVTTGSAQPVEVRQISTTDPQFFLGTDPATIAAIGAIITWALAQWKLVEEIRKLRSETRKNESFTPEEIAKFFDSKIETTIKTAVETKVNELSGPASKTAGVSQQNRSELAWALESVLARVERGMTVEVRFLPPPTVKPTDDQPAPPVPEEFAKLHEISSQLVFPAVETAPVLKIPPPEPSASQQAKK